jgi:hypothetical protein
MTTGIERFIFFKIQNGVQLENGEIVDIVSMQGSDSLLRLTLTIAERPNSRITECTLAFSSATRATSLMTFDLLVTVPSPIKAVGDFLNQRGITAVIGVMAALIILMAIATALSYTSLFNCKRREDSCAKSPSELMGGYHSDPFVLGTDNPNRISPTSSPV